MRNYTIWSPFPTNIHGGVRALHQLKKELLDRGCNVQMHYEGYDPESIVIYPEIVSNNPLRSPYVVRWLLNKGGFPELQFGWVHDLGAEHLLTVNIIELDIFHPQDNERSGTAFWVGKGHFNSSLIPENCIEINQSFPSTRQELANILSSIEYLISFDDFSAINIESTLLGTPVVIHSSGKWSREQMTQSQFGGSGICWSIEDLPQAKLDVKNAFSEYQELTKIFDKRIDEFIRITQETYPLNSINLDKFF